MAEQTITLLATWQTDTASNLSWNPNANRPPINSALTPSLARFFSGISFDFSGSNAGRASLNIADEQSASDPDNRADLSDLFETSGSFTITSGTNSLTVNMAGSDLSEPYAFIPVNSSEVIAFATAVASRSGNQSATLTLRDGASDVAVSGGTRHGVEAGGTPAVEPPAGTDIAVSGGTRHGIESAGTPSVTPPGGSDVAVSGGTRHAIEAAGRPASLPSASAPTVTISDQADIDANKTASLLARTSGGTYDSLAYAWDDGGAGGSFSTQTTGTVYRPPDVSADTDVTITCEVTATGNGTNAVNGTSDTADDTESFTVNAVSAAVDASALRMLVPLITIGSGTDIMRLAGHPADIEVGGETYTGGKAIAISPIEETEGTPDNRASISLSLAEDADFLKYGVDPGPLPVVIGFAKSIDSGATWTALAKKHTGRMSLPSIEGRALSFEIETLRGDVDRGGELVWSHESQRAEFPDGDGDNGMAYVRPIAAGDIEVAWPPIVPFVLAASQILELFGWAL